MIRLGVTGTRYRLTTQQAIAARNWIDKLVKIELVTELHHGACVGADEEILIIAKSYNLRTIAHPSNFIYTTTKISSDETLAPKDALERNRDIVDACNLLLALPQARQEKRLSGTWATIRYAERVGRQIRYIWPDGSISTTR